MLAFIVSPHAPDTKTRILAQAFERFGCAITWTKTIEAAARDPRVMSERDSIVVVPTGPDAKPDVDSVIEHASSIAGRAFVLYVADKISPGDYKRLLRLGSADSADWRSAIREIESLIQRLRTRESDVMPTSDPSAHRVVTFVGTGGGAGNTTLALESAAHLASLKGARARRVAVLDLQFAQSAMCDYFDLTPRLDLNALAADPQRLDNYMLEILASKHACGLDIFSCSEPYEPRSGNTIIFLLLNRLVDRYDSVLIDLPRYGAAEDDEILRNSDLIVVTGRYCVPSVKHVRKTIDKIAALDVPRDRIAVALSDADSNLWGGAAPRFATESVLPGVRVLGVRRDRAFALECVDSGKSMMLSQPRKGICQDIKKVADLVGSLAPAASS